MQQFPLIIRFSPEFYQLHLPVFQYRVQILGFKNASVSTTKKNGVEHMGIPGDSLLGIGGFHSVQHIGVDVKAFPLPEHIAVTGYADPQRACRHIAEFQLLVPVPGDTDMGGIGTVQGVGILGGNAFHLLHMVTADDKLHKNTSDMAI